MYLLLKDVHLREIMPKVASCLKVTNQNNGSEDQGDDRLQHTLSPSSCAKKQWVMQRDHITFL